MKQLIFLEDNEIDLDKWRAKPTLLSFSDQNKIREQCIQLKEEGKELKEEMKNFCKLFLNKVIS
jgi:hypothetical protein